MKIVPGAASFAATAAERPAAARRSRSRSATSTASTSDTPRCSPRPARAPRAAAARSAVLTFTPHPARLFAPDRAPPLIMSLERRLELLRRGGHRHRDRRAVHARVRGHRGAGVRARRAGARAGRARRRRRLRLQLRPRARRRRAACCASSGPRPASASRSIPPVAVDGVPCSSTRIRQLVAGGRREAAASCSAGRSSSRARWRAARAAAAGSASRPRTSRPRASCVPKLGIYAARARDPRRPAGGRRRCRRRSASARNPHFRGRRRVTVEAYLLDFDGDLYDRRLRLEVGERLRDERRFDSIDALVAQIREDVAHVRRLLS